MQNHVYKENKPPEKRPFELSEDQINGFATVTLSIGGDDDSPTSVVCFGHLNAEQFNKAHVNEGWDLADYGVEELKHIWGKFLNDGAIEFTDLESEGLKEKNNYKKMTITSWD